MKVKQGIWCYWREREKRKKYKGGDVRVDGRNSLVVKKRRQITYLHFLPLLNFRLKVNLVFCYLVLESTSHLTILLSLLRKQKIPNSKARNNWSHWRPIRNLRLISEEGAARKRTNSRPLLRKPDRVVACASLCLCMVLILQSKTKAVGASPFKTINFSDHVILMLGHRLLRQ